jgi:hypothetical protein
MQDEVTREQSMQELEILGRVIVTGMPEYVGYAIVMFDERLKEPPYGCMYVSNIVGKDFTRDELMRAIDGATARKEEMDKVHAS